NYRQDQRRSAESYARPGTAKEARTARQLHESDVSRRSHGIGSQAAADVATGPRRDREERAMMQRGPGRDALPVTSDEKRPNAWGAPVKPPPSGTPHRERTAWRRMQSAANQSPQPIPC